MLLRPKEGHNMKNITRFISPDGSQKITVSAIGGKKGFNLKATVKGTAKDSPKALTGMRATYATEKEAQATFDKVVKETKARGWVEQPRNLRNAFTTIPEAPVAKGTKGKTIAAPVQ